MVYVLYGVLGILVALFGMLVWVAVSLMKKVR